MEIQAAAAYLNAKFSRVYEQGDRIERWQVWLLDKPRPGPRTVQIIRNVFGEILKDCEERGASLDAQGAKSMDAGAA